jgi:hypothetical protein
MNKSGDTSLGSTNENEDNMRQRYSITGHPRLPLFVCSDGYLVCTFRLESSFSTQSRLIRELMHETIGLLNAVSNVVDKNNMHRIENPFNSENEESFEVENKQRQSKSATAKRKVSFNSTVNENVPEWGLNTNQHNQTTHQTESDSGVDSNDGQKTKPRANSFGSQKIAEGKIIFSFLPQILPISDETYDTNSVVKKMEQAFEYLQTSWSLLVSTSTLEAVKHTYECDQTAKAIQQAFTHFSYLFLIIDSKELKEFQIYRNEFNASHFGQNLTVEQKAKAESVREEEFKCKVLANLFMRMLKLLNFDPSAKHNPNSHMIIYVPRFAEKFVQSLIKFENVLMNMSRMSIFGLVYCLLSATETLMRSMYKFNQNERFMLSTEPMMGQQRQETVKSSPGDVENDKSQQNDEAYRTEKSLLVRSNKLIKVDFVNGLFEKCWQNLMHYAVKHRATLQQFGTIREKQVNELNLFIMMLQRRMEQFSATFNTHSIPCASIQRRKQVYKLNKADLIFLVHSNLDAAIDQWNRQLRLLIDNIRSLQMSRKAKSSLASLVYKSVRIAHKIFYACLANYKVNKLVLILSSLLMIDWDRMRDKSELYSQFSLLNWNFKCLEPPKRLQRTQMATISLIKSFARFVSLYLTNKQTLFIYSVNNPEQMPSLLEIEAMSDAKLISPDYVKIELSREKLTKSINEQSTAELNLSNLFTADKVLEMFVVCGLYDEAIYFLNSINDWKSAFLLSSMLKESVKYDCREFLQNLPEHLNCEIALTRKLCSVLGLDNLEMAEKNFYMKLMEKNQVESVSIILKELLLCSVMTKANVLEPLLNNLMESLFVNVHKLNAFVPNDFYLPAPPIFCLQMQTESGEKRELIDLESNLRMKICILIKCIMILLISSNLHVPLIKWYLDELVNSSKQMRDQYGIGNTFKLNLSLSNLLSTIRYQKLGYISESVLNMFRDFCAIVFYLDLRDHFSLSLRQYTRHFLNNQLDTDHFRSNSSNTHSIVEICLNIIDYGNMMLSYKSLLKRQHVDVQDIVLSTISRLTNLSSNQQFNLEEKLAILAERKYTSGTQLDNQPSFVEDEFQTAVNEFDAKFNKLIELWKQVRSNAILSDNVSMADVYEQNLQAAQRNYHQKLRNLYGEGEDMLDKVYTQKMPRNERSNCGEYEFERSFHGAEFLELFFKLSFDQTENWDGLTQSINQTPLLPAFYDIIRAAQLPSDDEHVDRQYIMTRNGGSAEETARKKSLSEMEQFLKAQEELKTLISKDLANQIEEVNYGPAQGLFRTYSKKSLVEKQARREQDKLRKSVSFSNLNAESDAQSVRSLQIHSQEQENRNNQPLRLLDFGQKYVQVSNLAIWLIKWSMRFQKLLINNNQMANRFWQSGEESDKQMSSLLTFRMDSINANMLVASVYLADGNNLSASSLRYASSLAKPSNGAIVRHSTMKNDDELTQVSATLNAKSSIQKDHFETDLSESTTLDISSLTDQHMNNYFSKQQQQKHRLEEETSSAANEHHRRQSSSEIGLLRTSSSSPTKSPSKSPNKLKLLTNQSALSHSLMKTKDSEASRISIASTNEASEFYNLHDIKPVENGSVLNDENTLRDHSTTTIAKAKENENDGLNKSSRSIKSSAFGFITNMFGRKSSKSPGRSKSPAKNPTSNEPNLQSISAKSTLDQRQTDRTNLSDFILPLSEQPQQHSKSTIQRPPNFPVATANPNQMAMTSHQAPTDIQSLIRDELKRIVQLQHDTVMSFLNNGAQLATQPTSTYSNNTMRGHHSLNNIEQQLTSILKQNQFDSNGPPMEFVIETKIKTASSGSGPMVQSNPLNSVHSVQNNKQEMFKASSSNFVRTFEYSCDQQQKSARKQSEFIKIKLLKIDSNEQQVQPCEPSSRSQHYPQTERFNYAPPSYLPPPQNTEMPLLSFRNDKHQVVHQNQLLNLQTPRVNQVVESVHHNSAVALNKHVKEYIEITSQKAIMNYKSFPLLKLNQDHNSDIQAQARQHQSPKEETESKESTIKPDQPSERTTRSDEVVKGQQTVAETKESKEIQIDKPLYDGYILAPGVFDDMLNKENERVSASSALAHYNATEHLRNRNEQPTSRKNKKESYTMTDVSTNPNPIAPDILFKLKFDLNRKNRQAEDVNENKDFLNVVDLDSNAVEDILKLIEHEQNKRQGKYVSISKKKPQEKPEEDSEKTKSDLVPSKEASSNKEETEGAYELEKSLHGRGDALTEKMFTEKQDKTLEDDFDKLLNDHTHETSRLLDITDSKQRMLSELKAIDQKIKLMNEMANEMGSDYSKYSQVLHKVVDLSKQREMIEKYQEIQRIEEEKINAAKQRKEEKVRFYERKEADDQIRDLKSRVLEPNKKPTSSRETIVKKTLPMLDVEEDDELSDLKDEEEEKVKKLLGQESLNVTSESKKETIRNLISDIFDDMDVDDADDLDSTKIDELLERSTGSPTRKTSSRQAVKPIPSIRKTTSPKRSASNISNNKDKGKQQVSTALNKLKPSKSPVRSRKELNSQANKTSLNHAQLNRTYDKVVNQKASPTVRVEKELTEKRNQLHDVFTHQRERDAKVLLKDILEDNLKLHEIERQSLELSPIRKRKDSKSPATSLKRKSSSPPTPPVPPLRLNETMSKIADIETARISVENKKPSLMAQTIAQLKRQETLKQAETERILRQLENRAQSIAKKEEKPKQIKYIKSFTDIVHLQNPDKLRNHPDHKAISYGEQLMMYQENTIKPETSDTNMNQLFKIYGTRRVKGVYNNYERKGPRKVKTYSERLRELKPQQSQVNIKVVGSQTRPSNQATRKTSATQIKPSSIRHNLQSKAKVAVNGTKVKIQRFTPYNKPNQDEDLSDMSRWSIDDKLKNIIYDDGQPARAKSIPINKKKPHATKSTDYDQETLADIDADYMLDNLIEEEAQNEKVFQNILNDLSDIERKEKQEKRKSSLSVNDRADIDEELDDYVNQVDIDELANISLSNESVSSFIDWDQIDKLVNEFK